MLLARRPRSTLEAMVAAMVAVTAGCACLLARWRTLEGKGFASSEAGSSGGSWRLPAAAVGADLQHQTRRRLGVLGLRPKAASLAGALERAFAGCAVVPQLLKVYPTGTKTAPGRAARVGPPQHR